MKYEIHSLNIHVLQIVDTENSLKGVRFCGSLIPRVFLSGGKKITLIFKSDNSVTAKGFRAHWKAGNKVYIHLKTFQTMKRLFFSSSL